MTPDTEHVWRELHANLRSFVSRRVRNAADVDDLVQRVFLQVHRALPTLRDDERIHAWVYQTTRNTIADYYRGPVQRREVLAGSMIDVAEGEGAASGSDDADERTALRELAGPPRRNHVFESRRGTGCGPSCSTHCTGEG